jgi:hypothetical protein
VPTTRSELSGLRLKEAISERNLHLEIVETGSAITPKRRTYFQSLRLYSGRYTDEPFLKLFTRPVILLALPPRALGCFDGICRCRVLHCYNLKYCHCVCEGVPFPKLANRVMFLLVDHRSIIGYCRWRSFC